MRLPKRFRAKNGAELLLAESAGFCFGVSRAVGLTREAAKGGAYALGHVIHNRAVVEELEKEGLRTVSDEDEIPPGATAVIRAHGEKPEVMARLEARGVKLVDTTCPCVAKIHKIAAAEAAEGRVVLIIGTRGHPEAEAISARAGGAEVLEGIEDVSRWSAAHPPESGKLLSVVAQTTAEKGNFEFCSNFLVNHYTNARIFDTICYATSRLQNEARALASQADAAVVIGDRLSTNTRHLCELCAERCKTYLAEGEADVRRFWPELAALAPRAIAVTAGASTPECKIEEVISSMSEEKQLTAEETKAAEAAAETTEPAVNTGDEAEESFAEMVDKSMKTLHTGERVKGIVTRITPTEVQMDLGTKHAGFIPLSELTDDNSVKPEEVAPVGSEIEVFVTKVNDAEGIVTLSKKRVDAARGWEGVEAARASRQILEGVVAEDNKGGVVVFVNGVRVFVPASQTGLPKEASMAELVKKHVSLRITEVNNAKHRVLGSIRYANEDLRKAAAKDLWENIDVGNVYEGVVKSLTSFGAFIDIGGADGMAHVTEISWQRLKSPADVLKVGDKVTARVIGLDREKRKISLSLKNEADNPWTKFTETYKVGDTVDVKIVKLMTFGAFAEVMPGVDGLIHISQLADRRIAAPADVVSVGDVVKAKIIDINNDKEKISLSVRAAMAEMGMDAEDEQ